MRIQQETSRKRQAAASAMATLLILCATLAAMAGWCAQADAGSDAGAIAVRPTPWGLAGAFRHRRRYAPNCDQMSAAYDDIKKAILSDTALDEDQKPYFRLIPGIVRLTFHMCTGGKCKGCLNVDDINNVHLEQIIEALEPVYRRHSYNFRRGDFWALAGIVALQTSEEITNVRLSRNNTFMKQRLGFRYGREDCSPSSPFTDEVHEFPDANRGIEHVLKFFSDNFNFSAEDAVIILGAHNLGGLRNRVTHRIVRQWTGRADNLVNAYYKSLRSAANQWTQTIFEPCATCPPLWHFAQGATGKRLMLNIDMALLKNLTFADGVGGAATCSFQTCPFSDTRKFVDEYADSDDDWQRDFSRVYMRMIETGYAEGELKTPCGCPTFTKPSDSK